MGNEKAPTGGQGWKKSAGNALFATYAAAAKFFVLLASIGRAGGVR